LLKFVLSTGKGKGKGKSKSKGKGGLPHSNTLVPGEPLSSRPRNLASRKQKHRSIDSAKCISISWTPGVAHKCDRQTKTSL